MTKSEALEKSIEIAKAFGEGGNVSNGAYIMEECYKAIIKISKEDGLLKEE